MKNTDSNTNNPFQEVVVNDEKTIFEIVPVGHPYRPIRSSILFVKKGRLLFKEQITEIEATSNTIILFDKKYVYETIEMSEDIELRLVSYNLEFIQKIALKLNKLKVYDNLKRQLKRSFTTTPEELELFWQNIRMLNYYIKNFHNIEYAREIVENYFNIILYHLVSITSPKHHDSLSQMTTQQAIAYNFLILVSENYLHDKSVQFYADQLRISIRHLSTVVKEITSKTPNEIIGEFILNEAKAQLSSTTNPIREIAELLKFSDQYAFAHFFKRHLNISPTQYRAQFK
ncbi:helix-turn-helix domain-containing protein [Myroides phaeus]|uniref:AraC-type DNA-binding protein n=1 Tax=Myroides phaeus TaxID=702745 RepID=A0A1G8EEL8_9FLAO|nr:AraC family transcriptional regulator [Myroides phaeus]MEC4115933.1 AraC family transcriptional regulator [Myroides phaeus]SDH68324.1 AraC-type DNA-binding protein [Myroides phaeus]